MNPLNLTLITICVFLGINTLGLLSLVFLARRRGRALQQLAQEMRHYFDSQQDTFANLLLLTPVRGRSPIKLLNFSEGAIHIRRIEQRHTSDPDNVRMLQTQDPNTDVLLEKNLLTSGDYSEVDVFSGVAVQYPQRTSEGKAKLEQTRAVLAKTTLSIHYFYSLAGDQDQEARFAITLYAERDHAQAAWQEKLEVKRYN